ncbi:MAG: SDR family oxidoreductase [Pseudomonadota bacterium]
MNTRISTPAQTAVAARLANQKVVITGGTTSIGLETARLFLSQGAEVLITGRSQDRLDSAVRSLGDRVSGFVGDSTRVEDLDALARRVSSTLGRIDVLFVNAGNGVFAPLAEVDEALYERQFDLNVKGVFFTVQKLRPLMAPGGSIILTASAVHEKGVPGGSLYFASKAAVRSLARSLAAELGPEGIRVNSLSPGIVPTQFFENSNVGAGAFEQFEALAGTGAPMGRAGEPKEIAATALFLASRDSTFATGADFVIDGGWSQV